VQVGDADGSGHAGGAQGLDRESVAEQLVVDRRQRLEQQVAAGRMDAECVAVQRDGYGLVERDHCRRQ
jgi:hypothetical protein